MRNSLVYYFDELNEYNFHNKHNLFNSIWNCICQLLQKLSLVSNKVKMIAHSLTLTYAEILAVHKIAKFVMIKTNNLTIRELL